MHRAALGLSLLAVFGSALADDAAKVKLPPSTRIIASHPTAEGSGRFVFGQVSDFRADQYLLDTKTGRLWQIVLAPGGGNILQPVPVVSDDGKGSIAQPPQ